MRVECCQFVQPSTVIKVFFAEADLHMVHTIPSPSVVVKPFGLESPAMRLSVAVLSLLGA